MRVDFNVPVKDGKVENDRRLRGALPSIWYVLAQGASLVKMSHLGRPDGQRIGKYWPRPVAERLRQGLLCWAAGTRIADTLQSQLPRKPARRSPTFTYGQRRMISQIKPVR